MSDFKKKLVNGISWKLFFYASSFLLNVFIAHSLGADESGRFYYLLNNLSFIVLFLSIGIDSGINYFNARKEIPVNQLFSFSIFWSFGITIILVAAYIICIAANIIAAKHAAVYLALYITGSLLTNCLSAVCFSMEDNKTPSLIFSINNLLLLFLLPANPLLKGFINIESYIKCYLVLSLLAALAFIFILLTKKISFAIPASNKGLWKLFFRYSLLSFAFNMLFNLLQRCDYWIVKFYCTDTGVGNYLQASKFSQLVILIPNLASFALFPLITTSIHKQEEIEKKIITLVNIYIYLCTAICIAIAVIGYWLFPILYGQSFNEMYRAFILLIPGLIAMAASYPIAPYFTGKNLIKVCIKGISFSIAILLLIDFMIVPHYAIYGAAIGSSVAYSFYFLYLMHNFKRHTPVRTKEILSWKTASIFIRKNLNRSTLLKNEN